MFSPFIRGTYAAPVATEEPLNRERGTGNFYRIGTLPMNALLPRGTPLWRRIA